MKTSNTDIFRCLCSDLGVTLRDTTKVPSAESLGELRKELLDFVENHNDDWQCMINLCKRLNTYFIPERGWSIDDPISGFRDLYQLLSFGLKIPKQHTHEQERTYVSNFLKTEAETRSWRVDRNNPVTRLARTLVRRLTANRQLDSANLHGLGRHGPGAVFNHEVGTDKNFFSDPPHDMALSYGHEFFFCNSSFLAEYAMTSAVDHADRHVVSRLALVPKDYRGPRGVFISPKEVVFCQLAQDRFFKDMARDTWLSVCYDPHDQSPSQEVAWVGSADRSWSTLDLSDASDRVPLSLMAFMFSRKDYLALARTRPSFVILPGREEWHRMAMFSPMGDGKTFSVLSLMVSVIVHAAILAYHGFTELDRGLTDEVLRYGASKFRIFGDDIAVKTEYYDCVCAALEIHNLKVNKHKSFTKGFFREACGMDAYRGRSVTPLRQKVDFDRTLNYHKAVEFHNRMVRYYPHLVKTIALVRSSIESVFPETGYTSNCVRHPNCLLVYKSEVLNLVLKREKQLRGRFQVRFNSDTQVLEELTYAPVTEEN